MESLRKIHLLVYHRLFDVHFVPQSELALHLFTPMHSGQSSMRGFSRGDFRRVSIARGQRHAYQPTSENKGTFSKHSYLNLVAKGNKPDKVIMRYQNGAATKAAVRAVNPSHQICKTTGASSTRKVVNCATLLFWLSWPAMQHHQKSSGYH